MNAKDIEVLLERYQQGTCTAEEKLRVEQWFDQQSSRTDWEWTEEEQSATHKEIENKINAEIDNPVRKINHWIKPLISAAAAVIILFTAFFYKDALYDSVTSVSYVEQEAPVNQQLKITLSDGTTIQLNAKSKIRYPKNFKHLVREVFLLDGEAYFNVQHNKTKPFLVHSGSVTTHVLGTSFNIRNYQKLDNIQVAVVTGKVGVVAGLSDAQKTTYLTPNQLVSINRRSGAVLKTNVDAKNVLGWQHGKLIFNNESFANIAKILEDRFNITINIESKALQNERLTAEFESTDRIEDVAHLLSRANNLNYNLKNDQLYFTPK